MHNIISARTRDCYSPKKPKISRPINCFMAFRSEKYQEILSQTPGINNRDISKIIAKWWKEMSEEQKAPYRAIAAKAKSDHELRYPNYTYQPIKKSERKVRPYHRREDAITRQRKAEKSALKLKQWLGEDFDTVPCLSPASSSSLQNSPTSSFGIDNTNTNATMDFNLYPAFTDNIQTDNDLPFLAPDLFASYDPVFNNTCAQQPPLSFDIETNFLFPNPTELDFWTPVDMPSSTLVYPDLLSLETFLLS